MSIRFDYPQMADFPRLRKVEAGETALVALSVRIRVPNRNTALPHDAAVVSISLSDAFEGKLPPLIFNAQLEA